MEIVNLIGRDRRPPKQRQSYMRKRTMLRRSGGPKLALHQAVIGSRGAERDSIPLVVGPHTRECAASGDQALEVIDVRGLQIRSRRLIVAAVLVEPWNRIGIGAAISGHRCLRRLLSRGLLCQESRAQEWQAFEDVSAGEIVFHCDPNIQCL
jgi:hypothetical protein